MNQDHRDNELDAAYRRASEDQAGRPAASTRAAILAEAEAAARRRTPAANDSRYLWRIAGAVAVVGIGVLIWRQTDVRLPGEAPELMVAAETQRDAAEGFAPTAPDAQSGPVPMQAPVPAPREAPVLREEEASARSRMATADRDVGSSAAVTSDDRAVQKSTAATPAAADAELRRAAPPPAPPPAARTQMAMESASAPASAATRATTSLGTEEATRLLREHFPRQFESSELHRLWIVRDGDGQVLHTGELQPSQEWSHAEEQLRGLQGHTPGPWKTLQLRNAAGQLIELAVAEVEFGEPRR